MRPEDTKLTSQPRGTILAPDRSYTSSNAAAADLTRDQIDNIYSDQAAQEAAPQQAAPSIQPQAGQPQQQSVYDQTQQTSRSVDPKQWKQYHSAWQDYYQKYYEHYYIGAVNQVHQDFTKRAADLQETGKPSEATDETLSTDEALYDLRSQIVSKVQQSGKKVRKSKHFVPIIAALSVLMIFGFLQYNRLIIANVKAYVSPGEIDPQSIIVDPSMSTSVGPEPKLIIPKINVNVPVDYTSKPDQKSQLKAMENGVAYFGVPGANAMPGQVGNTVLSGHSSNDYIDNGKYKFVFVQLERLKKDDVFYIHYKGTRYTYTVTQLRTVKPTDVASLVYDGDKPIVTLITCTPVGTAQNRLLVTAEQINPDPAGATQAPTNQKSNEPSKMPGNSPTVIERIFGAN